MAAPDCPFTGTSCLPGLTVPPRLRPLLCEQSGDVPTFCQSCPGATPAQRAKHCSLWASGRMAWEVPEVLAPGPPAAALCNGSRLAYVAPRSNVGCARPPPSRSEALALLGSQTVVFIGDSLMRQVFTRTVAWLRGQSSLADPAWHSDAVYLADAEGDALVPLFLGYGAACALELVERNNQSSRCAEQLRTELKETYTRYRTKQFVRARRELWQHAEPMLRAPRWRARGPKLTMVFLWHPWYTPKFLGALPGLPVPVHVVVAGAIGTHVPCWSDGKAGGKCPIESVRESAHTAFWGAVRGAVLNTAGWAAQGPLRLFAWLGVPHGHTGGRYSNGNYSAFNLRAKRELAAIGRAAVAAVRARGRAKGGGGEGGGGAVHVRVVDYAGLVRARGLFGAGVLARRDDNTHFQCITRGAWFYPMPAILEAKRLKVRMQDNAGRATPVGGAVDCTNTVCTPHVDDGCADPVNLALVRILMTLVATRARRDRLARAKALGV